MKSMSFILSMSLFFAGNGFAGVVSSTATPIILPVSGVFIPQNGYDDNDMVQVVVDGMLPNACWLIDRTDAKLTATNNQIVVQQFARKQESDICKDESTLPPELKNPVSFMAEVSLGALPQGQYTIIYSAMPEGKIQTKNFNVVKAPNNEIDSLYYAITTDLYISKVISANDAEFKVNFSGYLSNPCTDMENEVMVSNQGDVIVLMPQVFKFNGTCLPIAKEFSRNVSLKTPPKGRYLMQIRSANGNAVNRLFTVK